ncbi:hypothetical protein Tco_0514003 [Tanacetum coccineum]
METFSNKSISLRFSIAASSSVPWIYLGQFWHTLKEDGSKYRLKFVLDRKELTLTSDDFRRIFQLPQATDNNHECFVVALKFLEMLRRLRKWWKEWKDEFVNFLLNSQNDPGNRLDPGSYKESLEVEKTDVVQPVNVFEEEEESAENDCELRRRVKGKHVM